MPSAIDNPVNALDVFKIFMKIATPKMDFSLLQRQMERGYFIEREKDKYQDRGGSTQHTERIGCAAIKYEYGDSKNQNESIQQRASSTLYNLIYRFLESYYLYLTTWRQIGQSYIGFL